MPTADEIRAAFDSDRVLFSQHARDEMRNEPLGRIREHDVTETVETSELLEDYPDDEPYPSSLSAYGRPLHLVISYDEEDGMAIVVTAYEPNPKLWINYRQRKS